MAVSPDTDNYIIGKANVYFTPEAGVRRHMGNVAAAQIEPTLEVLDHFSSMTGVRTKDKTVVLEKGGTVNLTLEEWTPENIALAMLGEQDTDTDGNITVSIMTLDLITGRLEVIGSNDVGPKLTWDLPAVTFRPNAALDLITDEWGQIEISGELLAVAGDFGTITFQDSAVTA